MQNKPAEIDLWEKQNKPAQIDFWEKQSKPTQIDFWEKQNKLVQIDLWEKQSKPAQIQSNTAQNEIKVISDKVLSVVDKSKSIPKKNKNLDIKCTIVSRRINVSFQELTKLNSNYEKKVISMALEILLNLPINDKMNNVFLSWGTNIQWEYTNQIKKLFELQANKSVNELSNSISKIAIKLDEISKNIFDPSILSIFTKKNNEDYFIKNFKEIDSIIEKILNYKPETLEILETLNEISKKILNIKDELKAYILVKEFIISYIEKTSSEQDIKEILIPYLNTINDRISSLKITLLKIDNNETCSNLIKQIENMHLVINDTIGNDIPTWYSMITQYFINKEDSKNNEIEKLHSKISTTLNNSIKNKS